MPDLELPRWTILPFAGAFWLLQYRLRGHIRLWALLTFPATLLHELSHALVGLVTFARPASFSLWPKRVGFSSWRLGYVGFLNLRWWNSGAVAMAPLAWLVVLAALARSVPQVPPRVTLQSSVLIGATLVWIWIAVAPGKTDWKLARENWLSALVFLLVCAAAIHRMIAV